MLKIKCANCLKAVAVPTRLKIFNFLKDNINGMTVGQCVKLTKLRQPTVTFHVNELEKQGLIRKTKKGKEVICIVNQRCDDCPLF